MNNCDPKDHRDKPVKEKSLTTRQSPKYGGRMAMPRQIIQFTKPQLAWMKQEAKRLGITVSDLVRRIIDKAREPSNK